MISQSKLTFMAYGLPSMRLCKIAEELRYTSKQTTVLVDTLREHGEEHHFGLISSLTPSSKVQNERDDLELVVAHDDQRPKPDGRRSKFDGQHADTAATRHRRSISYHDLQHAGQEPTPWLRGTLWSHGHSWITRPSPSGQVEQQHHTYIHTRGTSNHLQHWESPFWAGRTDRAATRRGVHAGRVTARQRDRRPPEPTTTRQANQQTTRKGHYKTRRHDETAGTTDQDIFYDTEWGGRETERDAGAGIADGRGNLLDGIAEVGDGAEVVLGLLLRLEHAADSHGVSAQAIDVTGATKHAVRWMRHQISNYLPRVMHAGDLALDDDKPAAARGGSSRARGLLLGVREALRVDGRRRGRGRRPALATRKLRLGDDTREERQRMDGPSEATILPAGEPKLHSLGDGRDPLLQLTRHALGAAPSHAPKIKVQYNLTGNR